MPPINLVISICGTVTEKPSTACYYPHTINAYPKATRPYLYNIEFGAEDTKWGCLAYILLTNTQASQLTLLLNL